MCCAVVVGIFIGSSFGFKAMLATQMVVLGEHVQQGFEVVVLFQRAPASYLACHHMCARRVDLDEL